LFKVNKSHSFIASKAGLGSLTQIFIQVPAGKPKSSYRRPVLLLALSILPSSLLLLLPRHHKFISLSFRDFLADLLTPAPAAAASHATISTVDVRDSQEQQYSAKRVVVIHT
jgi:hypothetical protein